MNKDTLYCDDCGYEIREGDTEILVPSLPADVASANAGESAVLCRQCHIDLVQRVADDEWAQPLVDEIRRLQKENRELREIVDCQGEVVRMAQRRHEERDEARRMYCLAVSENDKHLSAEDVADTWGWDCFKENPIE